MSTVAATMPRSRPVAWWGMVLLITTEATIFAGLLSSYFFIRATTSDWPLGGIEPPELGRISIFTVVLLASSLPVVWAERRIRQGDVRGLRIGLMASFVLGAVFLANQVLEYQELTFGWGDNAYGSLFYTITGLHGLHVLAGLLMSAVVQAKATVGKLDRRRHQSVEVFAMYWHFVDVVWVFVFSSLYLSAHL